ncbi:nucleotidyl transferase AbiEii/AbiGii toxin family protein [Paraburkholderia xenovorans]|uniref:nucleotidyl transferase AbiEii/AbiGii toxin family protein n=1 Tax=Paraburkholderia xenovorans TaxID=36873 RepID=UPI0038B6EA37
MKIISAEQKDLIDAITAEGLAGELSAFVLEKDVHVTDALHALADLRHDHVQFVFCGGTSLSKAHGLIERMSEDVDLKVVLNADHGLSQSGLRAHLGKLKIAVVETMQASGFQPIEEEQRALNANRYFASGWNYQTRYAAHASLRPHLRHIYDTYCIVCSDNTVVDRAVSRFRTLVDYDSWRIRSSRRVRRPSPPRTLLSSLYKHTGFMKAPWRHIFRRTTVPASLITC